MRAVVLTIVFALAGAGMLGFAAMLYFEEQEFVAAADTTEGEVIDIRGVYPKSSSRSLIYVPVVRFETPDGKSIEFRSDSGSNPPTYSVGERVTVLYDPAKPYNAKLEGWDNWVGAAALSGFGAVSVLLAFSWAWAAVKQRR